MVCGCSKQHGTLSGCKSSPMLPQDLSPCLSYSQREPCYETKQRAGAQVGDARVQRPRSLACPMLELVQRPCAGGSSVRCNCTGTMLSRFVLQPAPGFQTLVSGSPSPSSGCCASGSAICCVLRRYCDSLAQASPRLLSDKGFRLPRQPNSQKTRARADGLQEFHSEWPNEFVWGHTS